MLLGKSHGLAVLQNREKVTIVIQKYKMHRAVCNKESHCCGFVQRQTDKPEYRG